MACLLRKQLHCLQASQLVLMNEIPEFRSAGLFIRGINLPRLCKGRTIQSFNSVTSIFFFWTVSEELCEHEGACAKKLGKNSQVKKKSKHASERRASSKTCYAQQSAKHAFCASVRNILSHAMDGQRTEKEAALSWIFFFWHKAFPFSPRQKHIAAFRLPGEKRVSKRKWGVAVGCCTKHLCPVCRRCHLDAVASSEFSSLIRKTVSSQSTPFAFLMEMTFSLDTKQDIL